MKITGIIFVFIGVLSLIILVIALADSRGSVHTSVISSRITGAISFIVLGAFLISRAMKKKDEQNKRRDWEQK